MFALKRSKNFSISIIKSQKPFKGVFEIRSINPGRLLNHTNTNKKFWSRNKKEEEEEEVEEEIEVSDEEKQKKFEEEKEKKRIELEEKIKFDSQGYTKEEMDEINKSEEERVFMEITDDNRYWLYLVKRLSLYLNLPLSLVFMVWIDYGFGEVTEIKRTSLYYLALSLDYLFFINAVTILAGVRNIVLLAKYIPDERMVEFTKLSLFCKPYKIKDKVDDIKRAGGGSAKLTPFLSLKNKKSFNLYSLTGVGHWKDRKLYNSLFPAPVRRPKNPFEGKKFLDL